MILYFSGTGNCKYVAEQISAATNDKAVSIENCGKQIHIKNGENLGVVFPTHFWEVPAIMRDFMKQATINADKNAYAFAVATYGTTPGCSGTDMKKLLQKHGVDLCAAFSVKMPDNWTPVFDLSDPEKVRRQNENADKQLAVVIDKIQSKATGNHANPKAPYAVRKISDRLYEKARRTSHFTVEEGCIGCGLCAKKCPVQAIEMQNKKPVWTKAQCTLCLRCLHLCPKFAIQYGDGKTKQHGQYHHPKVEI